MEELKPIVFGLSDELYGVDINRVQGIEKGQQVVRIPNSVEYIKGIMNLRGAIIAVYDLRRKFGLPSATDEDRQYIVVKIKGQLIALEVDNVKEIHNVASGAVFEMPHIATGGNLPYFDKIIKGDDGLIVIIDVDNLFTAEELERIDEMVKQ